MRGTLRIGMIRSNSSGIIPAHAGNTLRPWPQGSIPWDHPRACGEHSARPWRYDKSRGSSPRMRGTRRAHRVYGHCGRIIPAHAGNTNFPQFSIVNDRDHPRACGEHRPPLGPPGIGLGSSPRMRGTPAGDQSPSPPSGIIPAHAGNTSTRSLPRSLPRDHPRACGEHIAFCGEQVIDLGSSPRMRGTLVQVIERAVGAGIIPAHAGNTLWCAWPRCTGRDHPRACGEHRTRARRHRGTGGSSPRMRGTHDAPRATCLTTGIIPAHAGNTLRLVTDTTDIRDHPRACGEHPSQALSLSCTVGSSPRMRGTL